MSLRAPITPMGHQMARYIFLILALTVAAVLSRAAAAPPQVEDAVAEPAVQVTVETIAPRSVVLEEDLSGRVAAFRRVEIRPQVGGLIRERLVEEGTRVAAGDVLFRIDPAPLAADLGMAEASLARAEATAAHARRLLERSDALLTRQTISRERNDSARTDLALAEAGVAEARALVERKRLDLDFATLRAPIAGYVAAGLADVGGLATPGSDRPLAVVQDLTRVYIDLRLPAAELDAILGAAESGLGPVRVRTERTDLLPLDGRLRSSDVIVDPGTGTVTVRVEVENPDLTLLPGMYVRARVPYGGIADALLVPEEAVLRTGDGGTQLVVVAPSGEATRRDVQLGARIGNRLVVTSGLAAGETVAIQGQDRVPEGTVTRVTTLAAAPLPQTRQP